MQTEAIDHLSIEEILSFLGRLFALSSVFARRRKSLRFRSFPRAG
jgi:hypothetical protein